MMTTMREELISKEMLAKRVSELGKEISEFAEQEHIKELTIVCILNGAVYFFTDLSRQLALDIDTKMEFIRVSSYVGENSSGRVVFKKKLDEPVTGKNVLVVEDIIDTGTTLLETMDYLKKQNPNVLKLCVLLDKPKRPEDFELIPDYVGFKIPDKFVVGYGLDFNEHFRNLPSIECIVKSEEDARKVREDKKRLEHQYFGK